jgi:hypothetical protein
VTLDLAHARSLHERSGDDPRWCSTCTGEEWPCSTALALGATGLSAWGDTPCEPPPNTREDPECSFVFINDDPCPCPGCMLHREHDATHVFPVDTSAGKRMYENRCWEHQDIPESVVGPCVMAKGHGGQHCNPNGIRWNQ